MQRVPVSVGAERKEGIETVTFVSERNEGLKLVFAGKRNGVVGMSVSTSKRRDGVAWWCLQARGKRGLGQRCSKTTDFICKGGR